jgi:hypothetical protein
MVNFICPHCRGQLRVYNSIIFLTKTSTGKAGLLLINAELGNYNVKMHPSYDNFTEGEYVEFICPICYEEMDADEFNKNLAKIIMQEENGTESTIIFSKIVGEKCTYKITDDGIKAFGKDADEYKSILSFMLIYPMDTKKK